MNKIEEKQKEIKEARKHLEILYEEQYEIECSIDCAEEFIKKTKKEIIKLEKKERYKKLKEFEQFEKGYLNE